MTDFERFLAEALPSLGLSPTALRRRNIRRRVMQRMASLGVHDFQVYLALLRITPGEREALRPLLTVTISRFFRNRKVFDTLARHILAPLSAKGSPARAWSAGCASGEEAFTLRILWEELPAPRPLLSILATDVDEACLGRAAAGLYSESSLREVPGPIAEKYFLREEGKYRLREDVVRSVTFQRHDLLFEPPPGVFDIILCRNAAFTYFAPGRRMEIAESIASALPPGGALVLGRTEKLPPGTSAWFTPARPRGAIYLRQGPSDRPYPATSPR